ncbi:DUF1735 domain-containing protein [Bacteroides fragilis]|nr:DUF1735 domain-containing protein [Bacteroides fragilis]
MNRFNYIALSACVALSVSSCDDSFDVSSKADGVLAVSQEGFNTLQSYNVGEKYTADLWIQQGGLKSTASVVSFSVDKALLDSMNAADGTSYELLPADCYQLTKGTVDIPADERLLKGELTYDPAKIQQLSGYDHLKYVLPLRATSNGMPLVPGRSALLLGFKVSEPIVTIMNAGVEEINLADVKELPVQIAEVTSDATIRADKDTMLYSIIKEGDKLSKTDWKIVSFTTEEPSGEGSNNGHAKHLIDGNAETFWHSRWQGGSDPLPYEIIIDMNHRVKIAQVELLPRGRGSNNPIKVVRFEASEDGNNWESIGQFGFTNQDAALKYYVKSSTARYIKLVIPDGVGNGTVAAIRELDVRGTVVN